MSDVIDQAEAIEATDRALRIQAVRVAAAALEGGCAEEDRDCADCAETIDPERLAVVPGARRCLTCEEARERGRRFR